MAAQIARIVDGLRRRRRWLAAGAILLVAALAVSSLHLMLHEVHLAQLRAAAARIARWRIAAALALTAVSYLCLTVYDDVALRAVGRPLPWRISSLASFTSNAISHNLGLALLTGGSARYRVYHKAGLSLAEVAEVTGIVSLAFWTGIVQAAALALVVAPGGIVLGSVPLAPAFARAIGVAALAAAAVGVAVRLRGAGTIGIGRCRLRLPGGRGLAGLGTASLLDMIAASATLFVLVPGQSAAAYPAFLIAYALAIVVALLTHVPGGIGVFETIILTMVPADRPGLFAALLLYRAIYYILPLLIAATLIAVAEGGRLRRPLGAGLSLLDRLGQVLAPGAVTLLVVIAGAVLLLSGALPGVDARLSSLHRLVPLPFVEGSHLAGSLVGTGLLLIAPALNARLRSGYEAARLLLACGALFSILKGFDYEEATLQLIVLAVLHYAQRSFYRRGGISVQTVDWRWLGVASAAVGLSLWAGFFAYKLTPYSDDLWWHFALDGNAPRFLRASFGAGVLLATTAFWHLLSGRPAAAPASALPEDVAARALAECARTDANLAFTGDKSFVVSASRDAFLMYRVQGRTWVVMGDPVGPQAAWSELVWTMRQAVDRSHGRLCFFQISGAMLPLIVELGLDTMKYGEEAHVALDHFSLDGPHAKDLRHVLRRAESAGLRFEIVGPADVAAIVPELRAVSDAWLADKGGREKGFSLGRFDVDYLARFGCAVVRSDRRILAFANLWTLPGSPELSVDLMRHVPDAPYGTMDMMFVRLFEWGRGQGYASFNLGLAPLSGLTGGRLAPVWAKLGRALFENGGRLYGFAGLRAFKAKFRPQWTPRYIATPRGLGMARALIDVARMVSA